MKPKLTYFDAPVSRGEECRLALRLAGVEFEDHRIQRAEWPVLKPTTPYGSLPLLELPGRPVLAQSNAILVLIGRMHGLHPRDDFEAARHESMMHHVEDLRGHVSPTMRISDAEEKRRARVQLAETYIPSWATHAERQIGEEGPFFGGAAPMVVDLKLFVVLRWLRGGTLDHIPPTLLDAYPRLNRIHDAVRDHPDVRAWYAKR